MFCSRIIFLNSSLMMQLSFGYWNRYFLEKKIAMLVGLTCGYNFTHYAFLCINNLAVRGGWLIFMHYAFLHIF